MKQETVWRRLGNNYKLSNLIPITREMIEEAMAPGVPAMIQREQVETILTVFAAYCNHYEKRIVP